MTVGVSWAFDLRLQVSTNLCREKMGGAFAAERGPIVNGGPGKMFAPYPKIASAATALASLFYPLDPPLLSMPYRKMKP